MFAVNNNGMIIFHPRLKTVVSIPIQDSPTMNMHLPHIICFSLKQLGYNTSCYPSFTTHTVARSCGHFNCFISTALKKTLRDFCLKTF